MSGNLMEWTTDIYTENYNANNDDYGLNTARGGFFDDTRCHVTFRYPGDFDGSKVGIRLVLKQN